MSEQTEMAPKKRTQGPQTYVVQMAYMVESISGTERAEGRQMEAWVDIATVTVPPRTPRKTAIKKALAQVGVAPSEKRPKLRALDVDSFEMHEPEAHQPPPEWRLR